MGTFGRADWLVNGVLFACYHLHEPWVIPQTLLVDVRRGPALASLA
ncbi:MULTISPECIES: hypothetical protein [unclassified Kribbella]